MHAYWHAQPWKSESSKQSNHTHNGGLDRRSQSMSASNFDTCRILEPKLSDLCSRPLMQRGQTSWTRSWMTTEVALRRDRKSTRLQSSHSCASRMQSYDIKKK